MARQRKGEKEREKEKEKEEITEEKSPIELAEFYPKLGANLFFLSFSILSSSFSFSTSSTFHFTSLLVISTSQLLFSHLLFRLTSSFSRHDIISLVVTRDIE